MQLFVPLFTLFILLMGGYLAKRMGFLKNKQARTFLDFTIIFALPCLIFERTYHLDFDFSLIIYAFLGLFSCFFAAFLAVLFAWYCKFTKATLVSIFLLSSFGNTIFIALPVISSFYPQSIAEIILYDILATALPMAVFSPFILSLASEQKLSIYENMKKILSFPPLIALILAFILKPLSLPEFIFEPLRLFGNAATPVALFAIGLGLGFNTIKTSFKSTIIVLLAKMLVAPLIFLFLALIFKFQFSSSLIIALFESAMPTMTLASALIMKAKLDSNLAISSIAFGILFSFISLPLLVFILKFLGYAYLFTSS